MNPIERAVRRVDGWQQRHRVPAYLFAVTKKFGDRDPLAPPPAPGPP